DAARRRGDEAERGHREADLTAEMARLLLGGGSIAASLPAVSQRSAEAYGLASVSVELSWVDSDPRRRALPLIVDGNRIGTVLVPADADPDVLDALQDRLIPGHQRELVAVIEDESARLSRLVDKLLDLTRLQAGSAEPRPDWVSVDEVVRSAI